VGGHSSEDNVEWPCDILIDHWIDVDSEYPTPEFLQANGYANALDARPSILSHPCHRIDISYEDEVATTQSGYSISRTWQVIESYSGISGEYIQKIEISSVPLIVCDTLPWNAPTGECESGHTLLDAVEWPADDTVFTTIVYPESLELNDDIHPYNVRPVLWNDTVPSQVAYSDLIEILNNNEALVSRTWTISDVLSGNQWSYVQQLYVFADLTKANACAHRGNGDPIPDVIM
jgi:hypothetical protein